jgi:hypothetical protein
VFTFAQNNSKNVENIEQDSGHIGKSSERIDYYFFAILRKNIWTTYCIALVFRRKENIFLHEKISRRRRRAHARRNMIYNCQTVTLWFNVDISSKNGLLR